MEISAAPTANVVKTPEAESETPIRTQPNKPLSVSNGVLKRLQPVVLQPHRHHLPPPNSPPAVLTYKECLKNHSASLGRHAVDGCGEFLPSPTADPANPTSLKCAACGCHRNFHRRETEDHPIPSPPNATQHHIEYQPHHRHHPPPPPPRGGHISPNSASPPPISSSYYYPSAPHMLLALSSGLSALQPDNNPSGSPTAAAVAAGGSNSSGRKRFRTKFTQDQKERMYEFADKVEWKMQKRDEEMIAEFCSEVGVEKTVFKVWMHNNKSTSGKRDASSNGVGIGINRNSLDNNDGAAAGAHYHHNDTNNHHHHHNADSVSRHVITADGSS